MKLDDITPVILTWNEEPNIERTMSCLAWARQVVVVDSGSTDATQALVRSAPNARLFERPFDSHAQQWNYAIAETGIDTPWILAFDADYQLPAQFASELERLSVPDATAGLEASFTYCVHGHPLRGSLYPAVTVLFRRGRAHYVQDGHTQRLVVDGPVARLATRLIHDDRKALGAWFAAQVRYTRLERDHIHGKSWNDLRWPDRIRKLRIVAPVAVLFQCLFIKGLILDGRAGWLYTLQRVCAETLLSLYLLEGDITGR